MIYGGLAQSRPNCYTKHTTTFRVCCFTACLGQQYQSSQCGNSFCRQKMSSGCLMLRAQSQISSRTEVVHVDFSTYSRPCLHECSCEDVQVCCDELIKTLSVLPNSFFSALSHCQARAISSTIKHNSHRRGESLFIRVEQLPQSAVPGS